MKQANYNVGVFVSFNVLYPISCAFGHFVETQAFPQMFVQPVWYCRRYESNDNNPYPVTFYYSVWLDVRLVGGCVDNVCTEHGAFYLPYPFVVHSMPGFYIMIADCLCVILHVVYNSCRNVG